MLICRIEIVVNKSLGDGKQINGNRILEKLRNIREVTSVTGKHYSDIKINKDEISGIRDSTGNIFKISVKDLYQAYIEKDIINTNILKSYITTRAQSPAYAILMRLKVYTNDKKHLS